MRPVGFAPVGGIRELMALGPDEHRNPLVFVSFVPSVSSRYGSDGGTRYSRGRTGRTNETEWNGDATSSLIGIATQRALGVDTRLIPDAAVVRTGMSGK